MAVYLDTSFLIALFIDGDAFASRALEAPFEDDEALIVSDFAALEFASVIARLIRARDVTRPAARAVLDHFDTWRARFTDTASLDTGDAVSAAAIIRRFNLNIRAPDAIHLATARRLDASVATYDNGMRENARSLGIAVVK